MTFQSINPATEELIAEYDTTSPQDVDHRLQMAEEAARVWRKTSFAERAERMRQLGRLLQESQTELAELMTREMGKPIEQAEAELKKCAWVCDFYAERAEEFLSPEEARTDAARSYVRYDPLGPVLAIMPWNFPYWQVFRFAAPAVMAGNVGVLKHASNVCGVALEIEKLFVRADFPAGVFTTLLLTGEDTSKLIGDARIRAVTLTGSERAGESVAAAAGRHLKPSVLELGGSDPFIVLADADLEQAAKMATKSRIQNAGQSCIAAKRFLVEQKAVAEFEEALVEHFRNLKLGDPMDRETEMGPLAREDLRESLHEQVSRSIEAGAALRIGGAKREGRGWFYLPTVLGRVTPGMAAFEEETFGPVATITPVSDAREAIQFANSSSYGLGASVWTRDRERAEQLAREIESGCVFINEMVKSDPRLPFGGVKNSGYGRELSKEGIRAFVNVKTVWVQ